MIPDIMDFLTCFQYMQCITFYSIFISMPSGWVYATNIKHIMHYKYYRLMKIFKQVEFYILLITNQNLISYINIEKASFMYYSFYIV